MKKLVIFDLDGTLLYTLEDLMDSVNFTADLFGYEKKSLEEISSFVGNGIENLLRLSFPSDITEEEFQAAYKYFKDHYSHHCCEKTRPYDGIIETLKTLKKKELIIGIVSNKFQKAAEDVCEYYFKGLYNIVVGESDYCKRKPAPDGINMICEKYNIKKEDTIFFGDSDVDIKTGENAGVFCVSVLWGFMNREFLAEHGAKLFIENPANIIHVLDAK